MCSSDLVLNYLNPNNTGSPFYDTGTGTAGDQPGDFPTGDTTTGGDIDWSSADSSAGYDPNAIDAGAGNIFSDTNI